MCPTSFIQSQNQKKKRRRCTCTSNPGAQVISSLGLSVGELFHGGETALRAKPPPRLELLGNFVNFATSRNFCVQRLILQLWPAITCNVSSRQESYLLHSGEMRFTRQGICLYRVEPHFLSPHPLKLPLLRFTPECKMSMRV